MFIAYVWILKMLRVVALDPWARASQASAQPLIIELGVGSMEAECGLDATSSFQARCKLSSCNIWNSIQLLILTLFLSPCQFRFIVKTWKSLKTLWLVNYLQQICSIAWKKNEWWCWIKECFCYSTFQLSEQQIEHTKNVQNSAKFFETCYKAMSQPYI